MHIVLFLIRCTHIACIFPNKIFEKIIEQPISLQSGVFSVSLYLNQLTQSLFFFKLFFISKCGLFFFGYYLNFHQYFFSPNCYFFVSGVWSPWYLYQMVAQNTVRTYGVNQVFRFVESIWLHRKSRQIRFSYRKKTLFISYVRNVK